MPKKLLNLSSLCFADNLTMVKRELASAPDLDVLSNEGIAFHHALRNKNLEMFKSLEEYYFEHISAKPDTTDYNIAVAKFKDMLEYIFEGVDTSEELKKEINKYLNYKDIDHPYLGHIDSSIEDSDSHDNIIDEEETLGESNNHDLMHRDYDPIVEFNNDLESDLRNAGDIDSANNLLGHSSEEESFEIDSH